MSSNDDRIKALEEKLDAISGRLTGRYEGPLVPSSPVRPIRVINDSKTTRYVNKLLIGTPATGLIRMEWAVARYNQTVPQNWSMVQMNQFMNGYVPMRYQVADAQNLIVKAAIHGEFEWLLLIEHDVILPPSTFITFNRYMNEQQVPVVSGLYFTRSRPSQPCVYRGRGNSFYGDWELGDEVWVDGCPTGCLLIHSRILEEMWKESDVYLIQYPDGRREEARKVFTTPRDVWYDPESGSFNTSAGTSDLDWCTRVMENDFFKKAGWDEYQDMEFPFLIDTNIFCRHINPDGELFP